MLNTNSRANTVISQSFIASEFQGYTDPFNKAEPTSSLNQFVRSKQTSGSGFLNQDGKNQTFGFGHITHSNQPRQLESFSRNANQPIQVNVVGVEISRNRDRLQSQDDETGLSTQPPRPPQYQSMQAPQQLNQRYVSPNVIKTESPYRAQSFVQQPQRPPQQFMSNQLAHYQSQQQTSQLYNQQQLSLNQQSRSQVMSQQSRAQSNSTQNQTSQQQLAMGNSQLGSTQLGSSQLSGSRPIIQQQNLQGSSVGKRLKLSISQQFSDSFVLKCVNQPQKSSILAMKQRQRQFRKSIQNFFL